MRTGGLLRGLGLLRVLEARERMYLLRMEEEDEECWEVEEEVEGLGREGAAGDGCVVAVNSDGNFTS